MNLLAVQQANVFSSATLSGRRFILKFSRVSLALAALSWATASVFSIDAHAQAFGNRNNRIVGGARVNPKDPVVTSTVALYDGKGLCTGSIVDTDLVVTAAHCLVGDKQNLKIVFGIDLKDEKTIVATLPVIGMLSHPGYRHNSNMKIDANDIALVRFSGALPAGYKPATLLPSTNVLRVGTEVVLAGYGVSDGAKSTGSGLLRKVAVTVAHPFYGKTEIEFDQSRGKGGCFGDSGGPAFLMIQGQPHLFGVTSRGPGDCTISSIYTKIDAHRAFLAQAADQLHKINPNQPRRSPMVPRGGSSRF